MRLASSVLRDVQLKWPVPRLRVSLLLPCSQPCTNGIARSAVRARPGIRSFSISPKRSSRADRDLIHPELSQPSKAPAKNGITLQRATSSSLVLESKTFHKWSALLADSARLAVETDFFRQGSAKEWGSRLLVDKFENHGDLALWCSLLDYQMRINGPSGVAHVWKGLWGRKALYEVDSPLADMFWRVVLEGALMSDDPSFLESIWIYSEWMYDLHQVKWPHLYTTVIKHMLRTHQHHEVLKWQLRLTPNFYPGSDEFAKIIKEFALDEELYRLDTLPALYKTSREKSLYNVLIPYLFDLGESTLARKWRRDFIRHGEVPLAPAPVRPFLRFLVGYHPNDKLIPEELAALKFTPEQIQNEIPNLTREFMNRVHGRTFGITVKSYNDQLGAKWFASSWVSLNAAISTVSALGIENIGPLSLQSIALRTKSSEELLNRISQLREHGISVVNSNYYQTILYLARQNDDELLYDLLRSDLHPDVFDDFNLQTQLINSINGTSDWRTLRLLLVARFGIFERSARGAANSLLRLCFQQRNQDKVLNILEDMKTRNIPLNFEEAGYIYESLIEDYNHSQRSLTVKPAAFYLSIFRQLKSMDVPVPLSHWKLILLSMARRGRLKDLERLSIELVDMFLSSPSLRPGFAPVHVWDLPVDIKDRLGGVENLLGVYVPQDIQKSHGHHPLRQLFNSKVITEIIENAFIAHPGQGFHTSHSTQPGRSWYQGAQIAMMLRLLRLLHERGMWLRFRKVQFIVTNCLVNIYGPGPPVDNSQRLMRASNTLRLKDMKTLIDQAWGRKLLLPLDQLAKVIQARKIDATLDGRRLPEEQDEDRDEEVPDG
ncbi:hypothetical protein F4782DRAFT_259925 [Xylaria castorea]|nr:hypothetical protein F4782DRAFT_259925 [Xylaria castorea]